MRWRLLREMKFIDCVVGAGTVVGEADVAALPAADAACVRRQERVLRQREPALRLVPFLWLGALRYAYVGGPRPDVEPAFRVSRREWK